MLPKLTFVLGGAASGKSLWAENYLLTSGLDLVYLATSRAYDSEIKHKIAVHQSRRNDRWHTLEADLELSPALQRVATTQAVLVDCATMWLSNQMMDGHDIASAQTEMIAAITNCAGPVVVVSNEVGHGIVPDNALARSFREAQGRLNIALAEQADLAVMVVAGLPVALKGRLP